MAIVTTPTRIGGLIPERGAARKPGTVTVKVAQDECRELWRVQATVAGADPVTVRLAMRGDGASAWKRIGADQSARCRAFVDLCGLRKGTRVHFVAVVRSSSGDVATSRVASIAIPRK